MHGFCVLLFLTLLSWASCVLEIGGRTCNRQRIGQSATWKQLQTRLPVRVSNQLKSLAKLAIALNPAAFLTASGGHARRFASNKGKGRQSMLCSMTVMKQELTQSDELQSHAVRLRDCGFTVIEDSGIDRQLVDAARIEISSALGEALDGVAELGIDPVEQFYRFTELACRNRKRWDFQPQLGPSSAFKRLLAEAVSVASPIIECMHKELPPSSHNAWLPVRSIMQNLASPTPSIELTGAVISRAGANIGHFHRDASENHIRLASMQPRHRVFNVFIPLSDIAQDGDGTMFWPGSHNQEGYAKIGELENDEKAMSEMVAPACPAGGIMLFDYRIMHRGLPNLDRERVVAYAALSTGGARDENNFPPISLWSSMGWLRNFEKEEQQAKREYLKSKYMYWQDFRKGETEYTGA